MAISSRPIPALYTVYVLRSTVRHGSLYIGSTPNPPRRLKQHNGKAKGGAVRTSRNSVRPWEMVALVSGFPSSVGALKFEWALTNPHLSLHIPTGMRIAVSAGRKRNGQPRRPRASLGSILSNLHLLLCVPSFARWPLQLRFFARDVHKAWEKQAGTSKATMPAHRPVMTDFHEAPAKSGVKPSADEARDEEGIQEESERLAHGIDVLPLDYAPMKGYVEKSKAIFDFEQEGNCVVCSQPMQPGKGLYVLCSNEECRGVGHLECWSRHLLPKETEEILPVKGHCPSCHGEVEWGAMMKEVTLRVRAPNEVEKLLKTKRKKRARAHSPEEASETSE